jgi:hypothetical protein
MPSLSRHISIFVGLCNVYVMCCELELQLLQRSTLSLLVCNRQLITKRPATGSEWCTFDVSAFFCKIDNSLSVCVSMLKTCYVSVYKCYYHSSFCPNFCDCSRQLPIQPLRPHESALQSIITYPLSRSASAHLQYFQGWTRVTFCRPDPLEFTKISTRPNLPKFSV